MRSRLFVPHSQPSQSATPKWRPMPEIAWPHDRSPRDWKLPTVAQTHYTKLKLDKELFIIALSACGTVQTMILNFVILLLIFQRKLRSKINCCFSVLVFNHIIYFLLSFFKVSQFLSYPFYRTFLKFLSCNFRNYFQLYRLNIFIIVIINCH